MKTQSESPTEIRFLTTAEVCAMLKVGRTTLIAWEKRKLINPIKIGRRVVRYKLSDIEQIGENKMLQRA